MYDKPIDHLVPGDVVARTIRDRHGNALLTAGTPLTAAYIDSLRRRGHLLVAIRDGLADDVLPRTHLSASMRNTIAGHVSGIFGAVAEVAEERGRGRGGIAEAIADLGDEPLPLCDGGRPAIDQLYADVEALIAAILGSDTLAGLETLRTHNEYTFQHSVDVAVIGVLLGTRMGLPAPRLRDLALGCLLHDLGKLYIDEAILDKPGRLSPEEFAAVKEHPRMGLELIRRMPVHSILPAHVAYQHHERQRGGGYPQGLVGDNRIGRRLREERIGAGKLLLIAEIGAVADVYSAVRADRPYRPAMPPDEAVATVEGMAGHHLNRDIVDLFRHVVPRYPIGRWVELSGGMFDGQRGVVTDLHLLDLDRPTVRLLLDDRGEALPSPREVHLGGEDGVRLRCVTSREPVLR